MLPYHNRVSQTSKEHELKKFFYSVSTFLAATKILCTKKCKEYEVAVFSKVAVQLYRLGGTCPQSGSPKFTNSWANFSTKCPIARKYPAFSSFLLVHTEKADSTLPHESVNLERKDWGLATPLFN
jgi:hypothetical protein